MERFWSNTNLTDGGCIEWQGAKTAFGYGRFTVDGLTRSAHRAAYEITHGAIPRGLVVMHTCDNPACVNPAHLKCGTTADNNKDMRDKGRGCLGKKKKTAPDGMPPAEFVASLATLGLSVRQYADMTGESPNNMRNWATIRLAIPEPHAAWLRRNVAIRLADPAPTKETR